jgi:hypothetical protein
MNASDQSSFLPKIVGKIENFLLDNQSKENTRTVILKVAQSIRDKCPELAIKLISEILNNHLLSKEKDGYVLLSVNKVILEYYIDILRVFLLTDFKIA